MSCRWVAQHSSTDELQDMQGLQEGLHHPPEPMKLAPPNWAPSPSASHPQITSSSVARSQPNHDVDHMDLGEDDQENAETHKSAGKGKAPALPDDDDSGGQSETDDGSDLNELVR